jgi:peptidoglycan/LPS O-acetylase OafA/YrhL
MLKKTWPKKSGNEGTKGKLKIIDFLKGIAISWVLIIHLEAFLHFNLGWFDLILQFAVPMFMAIMALNFAISWEKNSNLKQYFFRRAKRFLPPFFVALSVSTILAVWLNLPLEFGERQLVGYFFLGGSGNYFIPVLFQFVLFFPVLYFIFKKNLLATALLFIGLLFLLPNSQLNITAQYNLIRFLPFIFIGFLLSKKIDWIRRHDFGFKFFEMPGKYSYQIYLFQVVFFSKIFW